MTKQIMSVVCCPYYDVHVYNHQLLNIACKGYQHKRNLGGLGGA